MKPYVNQAGIKKENIKVTVSGLTFTLDGFSRTKRQGENVIAVLPNPHKVGKKCIDYISLDRHPEIETIRKSADDVLNSGDGLENYKKLIDLTLRLLAPFVNRKAA